MSQIICIHSFRGGTGKSNTTVNLAAILAMGGARVAVIDTDIVSPGVHTLLGISEPDESKTLNDYLWGECEIAEAARDVSPTLGVEIKGRLYLIPASIKVRNINRILKDGYDVGLLIDGYHDLIDDLELDYLLIDSHPGLNTETLLSISMANTLCIVLRPDQQDFQGTGIMIDVVRKLDIKDQQVLLVVNKVPPEFELADVRQQVEQTYSATVGAIVPHSTEIMALASRGVFVLRNPEHAASQAYETLCDKLVR